MSKELKFLRETIIKKQVIKETRIKDEKDPSIEVVKKTKKAAPIKVAILKPTRKLFEAAEIFYAKKIADYLREGLLPISLVAKRYANDGGVASEPDKQVIEAIQNEKQKCQVDYFNFDPKDTSEETNTKKKDLLLKISSLNEQLSDIQNAYSSLYDSTAEMKARGKTIEWWLFHLSYIDWEDKGYKPLFGEGTYEDKCVVYEGLEEQDDPFTIEVISFFSYAINFWLTARGALTKEEMSNFNFEAMEKLYFDTVSTYKIEEGEDMPVAVTTNPPPEEAKE